MYSVLIVGSGNQGAMCDTPESEKIISFAHGFKTHKGFNLLGFNDANKEKSMQAAIRWNTQYWVNYWPPEVDVIVISTPDEHHYEPLIEVLHHKPKLVIVEKPICSDLQQARDIVALYKEKGIPLMVDYTRRFIPELQKLKQRKPVIGYCNFNRGWLHTGSHAVDFFEMLDVKERHYCELSNFDLFRAWDIKVMFEDGTYWHEQRIGDDPVPSYYNDHMAYVVENAYKFLEGKEPLKCTGEDALKTLEITYELMG